MSDPRPVRGMIFVGAGTYVGDANDLWIHKNAYDALAARVAELEAQLLEHAETCTESAHPVSAMRQDAARYRWLRDNASAVELVASPDNLVRVWWANAAPYETQGRTLDDAIDAALSGADRGCHEP